jgi:hypothetical protein
MIMSMFKRVEAACDDQYEALLEGLETEFGSGPGDALTRHFIACEEADFHWEARSCERYLGVYRSLDEEFPELDRVAIAGSLSGVWYVGIALVNGEGAVQDLAHLQRFDGVAEAQSAFIAAV